MSKIYTGKRTHGGVVVEVTLLRVRKTKRKLRHISCSLP